MTDLAISLDPLPDNVPNAAVARAEHDTVGRLTIVANSHCATEGMDLHENAIEGGPLVSGYPMAQWLAWNWWRLRWEPPMPKSATHRFTDSWAMSHMLSTIGSGYCWPDITVTSDGFSTELACRAWTDTAHATFRYLGPERTEVVSMDAFDSAVDAFIESVLELLPVKGRPDDSLRTLWAEILEERQKPAVERFRRMEARLGSDPDEREEKEIEALLARGRELGEAAFEELASDPFVQMNAGGRLLRDHQIEEAAKHFGFHGSSGQAVMLHDEPDQAAWGFEVAWKVGESAAQALRKQERLGLEHLTDQRLCDLVGVSQDALEPGAEGTKVVAFMLYEPKHTSVVLRSRNQAGRRFELARLIGDRALVGNGMLFPATSTSSYRQKVQRAFAAELLCPWEAAKPMLHDVVSEDDAMDVADYFGVSPLLLMNRIEDHRYRTD